VIAVARKGEAPLSQIAKDVSPGELRRRNKAYPLVRDLAADDVPVAVTCPVLGFSKQAFCCWRANPVSRRDWDQAHLIRRRPGYPS